LVQLRIAPKTPKPHSNINSKYLNNDGR
jgi:hypothetical protein